jgi:hypothetical protein
MCDTKLNQLRCDSCGRFLTEGIGTSGIFVPDSHLTQEEFAIYCKTCTKLYGPPLSRQSVWQDMCCWVNNS